MILVSRRPEHFTSFNNRAVWVAVWGCLISYYITLSKVQEWQMLCHYLLDRQAIKLFVWEDEPFTYLPDMGRKIGGDCLGDRQWWGLLCLGLKMSLFEMFYLTLIVTNVSAI